MTWQHKGPGLGIYCPADHLLVRATFRGSPVDGRPSMEVVQYRRTGDEDGVEREWGAKDGGDFPILRAACPCQRGRWWAIDARKVAAALAATKRANGRVGDYLAE